MHSQAYWPSKSNMIISTSHSYDVHASTLKNDRLTLCDIHEAHSFRSNDREVILSQHLTESHVTSFHRWLTNDHEDLVINQLGTKYAFGSKNHVMVQICRDIIHDLRHHPCLYFTRILTGFEKRTNIDRSILRIHQITEVDSWAEIAQNNKDK